VAKDDLFIVDSHGISNTLGNLIVIWLSLVQHLNLQQVRNS